MPVSVADMAPVLSTLDARQVEVLVRRVLKLSPERRADLRVADRIRMGLYEWLLHLGFINADQAGRIVDVLSGHVDLLAVRLEKEDRAEGIPTCVVTVADKRFVTCTGMPAWYDVDFDEVVTDLPEVVVTAIICNTTALHFRMERWRNRRGTDADRR